MSLRPGFKDPIQLWREWRNERVRRGKSRLWKIVNSIKKGLKWK